MDGARFKRLQAALLSAFPSLGLLRSMVKTGMNENLAAIASEHNLSECIFELIVWAEARGKVETLVRQAYTDSPNNAILNSFISDYGYQVASAPVVDNTPPPQPTPTPQPSAQMQPHSATPAAPTQSAPVASQSAPATVSFGILHLTDLHYGLKGQERFLPGILADFFQDLELLHRQSGPWDLILFSGDLVQSGAREQYQELQTLLDKIWQKLRELGSPDPILLAVPGNHDLARPKVNSAVRVLRGLASSTDADAVEIWEEILDPASTGDCRTILNQAFEEYSAWWSACSYSGKNHPNLHYHAGVLPGDFSAVLEKGGARLGIVGLNTTFLQLTGDNYEGKLAVDVLQLNKACEGQGAGWFENNIDACLLMTHQPPSWLAEANRNETFYREIDWPGRFAAHFCGHMHIPDAETRGSGWSQERRLVRGGSLFGLETSPDGKTQRIHAYAACRIEIATNSPTGSIRLWPRVAQPRMSGPLQFDRDTKYSLDRQRDDGGTRSQEFDRLRKPSLPEPPPTDSPTPR